MASPRLTAALLANLNRTLGPAGVALDALQRVTSGLVSTFQNLAGVLQGAFQGLQSAQKQQVPTPTPQPQTQYQILNGDQITQPVGQIESTIGVALMEAIQKMTAAFSTVTRPPAAPQKDEAQRIYEGNEKTLNANRKAEEKENERLEKQDAQKREASRRRDMKRADATYEKETERGARVQSMALSVPLRAASAAGGAIASVAAPAAAMSTIGVGIAAFGKMVDGITGAFSGLVSTVQRFSATLSPVSGMMFDRAMRDLHATIGVALLPVFNGLTQGVRAVSSALLPAMERLQPIFARVGGTMSVIAEVFANAVGSIAKSLTPLIDFAAGVYEAVAPLIQTAIATFSGLVKAVAGAFSEDGLKSAAQGLKTAFQNLASATVLTAAQLATWVSKLTGGDFGTRFIAGMQQALGIAKGDDKVDRKSADGLAPTNATTSDFGSFMSTVARSALLASMAGDVEKPKTDDWLEQLSKQLDEIKNGSDAFANTLVEKAKNALLEVPGMAAPKAYDGTPPPLKASAGLAEIGAFIVNPGAVLARRLLGG